jgi:hypothetical protein
MRPIQTIVTMLGEYVENKIEYLSTSLQEPTAPYKMPEMPKRLRPKEEQTKSTFNFFA